ncbi:MAG: hypothetical protein KDD47_12865, partial [Acidobacteria bacterium]|nr:hypothetical protein [Acidobacteriota bacterium]
PEQIDFLYIEAGMEAGAGLMEAVESRAGQGEPFEEIPLYFGHEADEYVIALFSTPGVSETQLEDHAEALYKDEEGGYPPAPEGWRSLTSDLLNGGPIRHFFRYPSDNVLHGVADVGTSAAALTASFRFTSKSSQEKRRMFSALYDPGRFLVAEPQGGSAFMTTRCRGAAGEARCKSVWGYLAAGKGDGEFYRATVLFHPVHELARELLANPNLEVTDIHLGSETQYFYPPGVVAQSSDEIIAYSFEPFIKEENGQPKLELRVWPQELSLPYNQVSRTVPGGTIKTSTWSIWSGQSSARTIDGKGYVFGRLSSTASGSSTPRAIQDIHRLFKAGATMGFFLAMPYDLTQCTVCTSNHPDPAIQALNGDYRVGAGFSDLRVEVTTRLATTTHSATVSATSVGGHDDTLFPGASREWDLELTALSGGASSVALLEQPWDVGHGVVFSFSNPATGANIPNPALSSVGEKVRLKATWQRADPSLYGRTKKVQLGGSFAGSFAFTAGLVEIPIQLKAPEGQPAVVQTGSLFDDNVSSPMAFADLQLPAQGLEGAVSATAELTWVSGPTKPLNQGQQWDLWSHAFPGHDGEVVIYPDQLKPGTYEVDVTPCLTPDGLSAAVHCLTASKQRLTFNVQAAAPATYPPSIDFVTPWGVDAGAGLTTFSVHGLNLEGTDPNTRVKILNLLAQTAPQPGDTDTLVSARVNVVASKPCGPRELSVITTGGTADTVINITQPLAASTRNLLAVEAEAGVAAGLAVQSQSGASNGKAVSRGSANASGKLVIFFEVPA